MNHMPCPNPVNEHSFVSTNNSTIFMRFYIIEKYVFTIVLVYESIMFKPYKRTF